MLGAGVGQRLEFLDPMNNASEPEQLEHLAEERPAIDIQAQAAMAEHAINEQEITGARAKIENPLWRHAVEADVLHAPNVQFKETLGLDVFRPISASRHTIDLLDSFQLR